MTFSDFAALPILDKIILVEIKAGREVESETWTATGAGSWWMAFDPAADGEVVAVKSNGSVYSKVASIALCDSTASSWFFDFAAKRLYVHTSGNNSPSTGGPSYTYCLIAYFWACFTNRQPADVPTVFIPQDAVNPAYYLPLLNEDSIPAVSQSIGEYYIGSVEMGFGSIGFTQDGWWWSHIGALYLWHNCPIYVKVGAKGSAYADFATVYYGGTCDPEVSDSGASIGTKDVRYSLLKDLPASTFTLAAYPNLEESAEGRPIPIVFGTVANITPVCVNTATWRYKISGALGSIPAVYLDGHLLTSGTHYTDAHASGEFTLVNPMPPLEADKLTNGNMESWASATNLNSWTETIVGSSTVNREATKIHGGTYSCRLDIDVDENDAQISQTFTLVAGNRYLVTIWYGNNLAGKYGRVQIYNSGSDVFLKPDGSWNATVYEIPLPNSLAWSAFTLEFSAHPDYTSYIIKISNALPSASSSIYIDDVSITSPPPVLEMGTSKVTCTAGGYNGNPRDALYNILTVLNDIPSADIDPTALAYLAANRTQAIAIYLTASMPTIELIRLLERSATFHLIPAPDGKWYPICFQAGSTGATVIGNEEINDLTLSQPTDSCFKTVRIKYYQDPTTGTWRSAEATDNKAEYRYGRLPILEVETAIRTSGDASALATSYLAMVNAPQRTLDVDLPAALLNKKPSDKFIISKTVKDILGNTITVFSSVVYRIFGLDKDFSSARVKTKAIDDLQTLG